MVSLPYLCAFVYTRHYVAVSRPLRKFVMVINCIPESLQIVNNENIIMVITYILLTLLTLLTILFCILFYLYACNRLLWAVLMAVASVTILVHLYASWNTFSYSSMQIVVDNPRYPLSKIDFPAVTICSVNKILYSKAKSLILR